jgi:hypothetical protein
MKKNLTTKKLELDRQTIRTLSKDEVARAGGAAIPTTTLSTVSTTTVSLYTSCYC